MGKSKKSFFYRLRESSLFKDSFWAVSGNGLGNFLMLLSGIFIAKFLGKDLYGEYGIVKSTMFLIALFATFGLGDTSTKFVAEFIQKDIKQVGSIIKASYRIAISFSLFMCLCLLLFADSLAEFVKVPHMSMAFRLLGVIIVFRALNTVGAGLLGGFKEYKELGRNNILSGLFMFVCSIPLTLLFGLRGALASLLFSQVILSFLNTFEVRKRYLLIPKSSNLSYDRQLFLFSFPFALNEFIYTTSAWGSTLLLTRYSSVGELGIFSACTQWESIILFMPSLLGNVILSYLSTTADTNKERHSLILQRMLFVNLLCTSIPLLVVLFFSSSITSFYGETFITMKPVLVVTILSTIFACMSRVFLANLTSEGKNWKAFVIRGSQHTIKLVTVYVVLNMTKGKDAAYNCALVGVGVSFFTFIMYYGDYLYSNHCKNSF